MLSRKRPLGVPAVTAEPCGSGGVRDPEPRVRFTTGSSTREVRRPSCRSAWMSVLVPESRWPQSLKPAPWQGSSGCPGLSLNGQLRAKAEADLRDRGVAAGTIPIEQMLVPTALEQLWAQTSQVGWWGTPPSQGAHSLTLLPTGHTCAPAPGCTES